MFTAIYEDEVLEVYFSGKGVLNDYGVPGSPTWVEIEDVYIENVYLLGVEIKVKYLPEELKGKLMELSDDLEWEEWE